MSRKLNTTPAQDGFWIPGEFEKHTQTWLLWPERPDNWRNGAKPAQQAFSDVAHAIAQFEPVTVGVSAEQYLHARFLLRPEIRVVEITSNDSWIRDTGPSFLRNQSGMIRGVDWQFNAWGGLHSGLYFPWDQDDLVAMKILELEGVDRYRSSMILEGGSIHVDGEGTLITTEECLLHPNRNPDLSKAEIEQNLKDYTGMNKVIWLGNGVFNDETNGHVDNLACFLKPGVLAITWTDDRTDPQYEISLDAYERLSKSVDAHGRSFEIVKVHQPDPLFVSEDESMGVDVVEGTYPRESGTRMAASYINFYLCNGGAVVPEFGSKYDELAVENLQKYLPDRKIVTVPAREILLGGGNIHCITQQQPFSE